MLEKAVSEDVKKVVNNWNRILNKMGMPMRAYMLKAGLSQSEDGKLFIVLDNKERVQKYSEDPGRNELSAILDDAIGKHVEFELRYAGQDKPMAEQYINLNDIHFDIEIEEEESMPDMPEDDMILGSMSYEPETYEESFDEQQASDDENAFEEKDTDEE